MASDDPEGGWRQDEDGMWRRVGEPDPVPVSGGVGDLVVGALFGGVVGVGVAFAVTYAVLSGQGESALVWAVAFIFFSVIAVPLCVGAALWLTGRASGRASGPS